MVELIRKALGWIYPHGSPTSISTSIDSVPVTLPVQSEMLALPNDQEEFRMSEAENRMLISRMLAGEIDWLEQWAGDAVWVIPGSTKWSGTYSGKTNIARNLLGPLTAELKSLGKFEIDNVVAEGNYVVVQGHVTGRVTRTGQQYNNTYCLVYEIVSGKIRKHTEYCDTELITKAFGT